MREKGMRTIRILTAFLLTTSVVFSQSNGGLFTGEVMDSPCAAMGSHDRMMKGVEAKDAKECSRKCVQILGHYVLYDAAKKTTYRVDNEQKLAAYAGQKVSVKGTYDAASRTIHIDDIQAH